MAYKLSIFLPIVRQNAGGGGEPQKIKLKREAVANFLWAEQRVAIDLISGDAAVDVAPSQRRR